MMDLVLWMTLLEVSNYGMPEHRHARTGAIERDGMQQFCGIVAPMRSSKPCFMHRIEHWQWQNAEAGALGL